MEKIVCLETVVERLDPNGGNVVFSEEQLARKYFSREKSYSRRMTTNTKESIEFWNETVNNMKTYIAKGDGFKYLVYDFMYFIDADTDEDGEVTEIYSVGDYFVKPISEEQLEE